MAAASGSPDTGPNVRKYTGLEAVLLGSRDTDNISCPGGRSSATTFSVLLVLGSRREDGGGVVKDLEQYSKRQSFRPRSWGRLLQGPP